VAESGEYTHAGNSNRSRLGSVDCIGDGEGWWKTRGVFKQHESLPDHLLEKAMRGLDKQITVHENWIAD
jgi:hypothetical protein